MPCAPRTLLQESQGAGIAIHGVHSSSMGSKKQRVASLATGDVENSPGWRNQIEIRDQPGRRFTR